RRGGRRFDLFESDGAGDDEAVGLAAQPDDQRGGRGGEGAEGRPADAAVGELAGRVALADAGRVQGGGRVEHGGRLVGGPGGVVRPGGGDAVGRGGDDVEGPGGPRRAAARGGVAARAAEAGERGGGPGPLLRVAGAPVVDHLHRRRGGRRGRSR